MHLVQAVGASANQRGDGQVERKLGSHLAFQPTEHTANDGRTAAARAGNHGKTLHQADLQCIPGRHVFNAVDAGRLLTPFGPENDEGAQNERHRHHQRREKVLLDDFAKQQTQYHGRQETNQYVKNETLGFV